MRITFEHLNSGRTTIDVWFNVFDKENKDQIGTFDDRENAVDFSRKERRATIIEVEYA